MKRIITLLLLITTYALSAQKTVTKIVSREQNSPLLVVNGVLIDDNKIGSIFLNAIDPNDIENINVLKSVLKDPSATVLCSSKAEKGVVISNSNVIIRFISIGIFSFLLFKYSCDSFVVAFAVTGMATRGRSCIGGSSYITPFYQIEIH